MLRLAIALLSLAASVIGSCPDTLPGLLEVPDSIDVTINYALVPSNPPAANNGLFCARLEVLDIVLDDTILSTFFPILRVCL